MHSTITDNSESQDCDDNKSQTNNNASSQTIHTQSQQQPHHQDGYYDADKCRAHIANQIRVSKIDRFAAQVNNAIEVESSIYTRLSSVFNMFMKRSALITKEFTLRCSLGFQRHRQDRILCNPRKYLPATKKQMTETTKSTRRIRNQQQYTISNDLFYGEGAQLVQALLTQPLMTGDSNSKRKHINKRKYKTSNRESTSNSNELDTYETTEQSDARDTILSDQFEPTLFVRKLEDYIRDNLRKSRAIVHQLNTVKQLFEKLASEHRGKVDMVYAAEEERQAASVTRRSAYNLSIAAIKATSTPIHVNPNTNE